MLRSLLTKVGTRVAIWTGVVLFALNAAQMVFTGWLYAESFKLQAEATELVYLSTAARQIRGDGCPEATRHLAKANSILTSIESEVSKGKSKVPAKR